jgi:hypothetical protein
LIVLHRRLLLLVLSLYSTPHASFMTLMRVRGDGACWQHSLRAGAPVGAVHSLERAPGPKRGDHRACKSLHVATFGYCNVWDGA